jgi:hypothetical protein
MEPDITTIAAEHLVRQAIEAQDFIAALFDAGGQ